MIPVLIFSIRLEPEAWYLLSSISHVEFGKPFTVSGNTAGATVMVSIF
jgi:hypothetical protein